jgi:cytochrome P450/NADPH-cytochrome P450 reductase
MLVGNLLDLDASHPIESLMELARQYGPIFEFAVPGRDTRAVISSYALVNELCDESRFDKMVGGGLSTLARGPVGRGLFTSETADPNWHKAHNVLLPAFSMDAMRGYYPTAIAYELPGLRPWK